MKINMFRKIIVVTVLAGTIFACSTVAFGATTLYEQITAETVAKGVTYEKKHRLTEDGWLDIHMITVDLTNSNISVEPIESKTAGLREKVGKLLTDANAIAGANSAYFGMTGSYSAGFGTNIANGEIISMDSDKNLNGNQFGTYFEDINGQGYFDYFKNHMEFYANGSSYFEFSGINTITQMIYPVYLDRNIGVDTKAIDSRFSDITKIVVEDGKIVKISGKGETVAIPENGYIVALSSKFAEVYLSKFAVGQSAEFKITSTFDVDKINTAISGGGVILKNGVKPENYGEMATGRQPRTLLGLSQDQKRLKIIVADGQRSNGNNVSIGLTVDEAIWLLKSEGMYNGLNLDGGGSSLMAVKTVDESGVSTVSSPAEGSERPVMTAVGVFDNSPVGEIAELRIKPSAQTIVEGGEATLEVYGYDENYHRIAVSAKDVEFACDSNMGAINGNTFTAVNTGSAFISATYNNMVATTAVEVSKIAAIEANKTQINLNVGESINLNFKGITADGHTKELTKGVELSSDFGEISGTTFKATKMGAGYITCSFGDIKCYVKVVVGTEEKAVSSFENVKYLDYISYPAGLKGIAGISTANISDGSKALGLSYNFKESTNTQAAYVSFPTAISVSGQPSRLKLDIKGNGTGQWVRAKIIYANGAESVIDFSRNVNWTDWQTMTADIPSNVKYPIAVKTIYVAALTNTITAQQAMYFDNLRGEIPISADVVVPTAQSIKDKFEGDTTGKESGYTYVSMAGSVTSGVANANTYTSERAKVNTTLGNGDIAVFAGKSDISAENGAEVIKWTEDYKVYNKNNVTLVNMFAKYGGFAKTKKTQWSSFKNDVLSTNNKNVIFFMDVAPSDFYDADEEALFQSALKNIADTGKNVFVISNSQSNYSLKVNDGVRYISLPQLWKANGEINKNFVTLRFKLNGETAVFETIKLY
ncbi:MAG TPA: hypothetical protein DIC60_03850 [Lachnospiraceae bacterium]|nr:hypothetical protein [Lachnospiraceae bacterium]